MNIQISIAAARVNAKMTQEDVAKALKVSKQTVCNWENGKSFPSIIQATQMSELFNFPLDNIIFLPSESN